MEGIYGPFSGLGVSTRLFDWGGCVCSLVPGPSRHEAQLKDPSGSECQYDNRPEDHREEQRYGQGQVALEDQEVHLHALEVLEDEDENHDQDDDADD